MKDLNDLLQEIKAKNDGKEKDRYMMNPSSSDVYEFENCAAGVDTNK